MKNSLFKIALAIFLLTCLLLSLSCGDATQNKPVVSDTANSAVVQTDNRLDKATLLEDCDGDAPTKKKKIKDGIEKSIKSENSLNYQYKKKFDFEPVIDANGDAILYIWGEVSTSAKNINQLNNTYERFVKKQCVTKVVFDKAPGQESLRSGFEFSLCEYPSQICSDGTCQQNCPKMPTDTDIEANVNANISTSSNTKP